MADASRPATGYPAPQNGYPPPGTNTAYPYAQQPPPQSNYYYQNNNPNPYYYNTAYATQRATFFRRFVSAFLALLIIVGVILFIIWLVLRPRLPHFQVDSLSLSQLNLSSSAISANWDVRFTVSNPNTKMHVYYDSVEADIYYKAEHLAQNQLPPFDQGTKTTTNLTAKLVASSAFVDRWVVSGISGDKKSGSVSFNVRVLGLVRFKAGGWRVRTRWLRVFCGNLPVGFSSSSSIGANGTLTGGPSRCAVGL
ncbi:hypothetical protein Ancab_011312 [Ancistrocladus abbreviatus]